VVDPWKRRSRAFRLLPLLLAAACGGGGGATETRDEAYSGGDTTRFNTTDNAFTLSAANLPIEDRDEFSIGNVLFNQNWVTAPSSTVVRDGLGPLFNAKSCSACHLRDGRGRPPVDPGEKPVGLLFKINRPGTDSHGVPWPDETYGQQIQNFANLGVDAEGTLEITYTEEPRTLGDGTVVTLRRPSVRLVDEKYGPLAPDAALSPRVAPSVFGLGLLASIPQETLLALADPDDADADGISGRPNWVLDVRHGGIALGRFGWKANQPTLEQQAAAAFSGDIGLTNPLFANDDCTTNQPDCLNQIDGGTPEIDERQLSRVTFYLHTLAVPGRRNATGETVLRGKELFVRANCAACHRPTLRTGVNPDFPLLSNQTIHPYTDLLLHDMGEDLADHREEFLASTREWRTPPLWGIGLQGTVNGHTFFLHDGRARNLVEAILWHGGEAEASRDAFVAMPKPDRDALIAFLNDL